MPALAFIGLIVITVLLVMIPTRRLFLAGWSTTSLTAYFLGVVALGLFVAELRGPARYLIPILVLAYVAPFVTARAGIARLRGRLGGEPPVRHDASSSPGGSSEGEGREGRRPEPKNVTPKDGNPPDAGS